MLTAGELGTRNNPGEVFEVANPRKQEDLDELLESIARTLNPTASVRVAFPVL
jgi:hypothetical protein